MPIDTLYKKFFAGVYDPFMNSLEKDFYNYRKELLSDLKGTVLEVGAGTGINFQFYPKEIQLIALEPSEFMRKRATLKVPEGMKVKFLTCKVNDDKLESIIEDNSLDYIVSTLVLCSIDDPNKSLEKFHRWLKEDGKLIVLEHIHSEKKINRKLQDVINPIWKKVADGCNLNRDTDILIKQNGFAIDKEKYFKKGLRFHSGIYSKAKNR